MTAGAECCSSCCFSSPFVCLSRHACRMGGIKVNVGREEVKVWASRRDKGHCLDRWSQGNVRGFNGFTDRQVGMGALQPTVSITSRLWGLLVGFPGCWKQAVTAVYNTLSTTLTRLRQVVWFPSLFACKGLGGHCNKSKTQLRFLALHKKASVSQVCCAFLHGTHHVSSVSCALWELSPGIVLHFYSAHHKEANEATGYHQD